jgi:hypothetical protein
MPPRAPPLLAVRRSDAAALAAEALRATSAAPGATAALLVSSVEALLAERSAQRAALHAAAASHDAFLPSSPSPAPAAAAAAATPAPRARPPTVAEDDAQPLLQARGAHAQRAHTRELTQRQC